MSDVAYRPFVYLDNQGVGRVDTPAFHDLFVEILQQPLVVADAIADRRVGAFYVQRRAQGLVHHVDHIEGAGVAVEIHVQLLVSADLLAAVLVQQLVAVFQRTAGQQQAALFLVVVDVRLDGNDVEGPLRLCDTGQQCQQYGRYQ